MSDTWPRFKKGDVVVANAVILDRETWPDGDWYIHSAAGGIGVVNEYGQEHPRYDVRWLDGSTCTVHASVLLLYRGEVERVVS